MCKMSSFEPAHRPRTEMYCLRTISAPSLMPCERVAVVKRVTGHFRPRIDSRSAKTTMKAGRSCVRLGQAQIHAVVVLTGTLSERLAVLEASCPAARSAATPSASLQENRHLRPVSFPPNQACRMRAKGGKCSAEGCRTGLRTRHAQTFTQAFPPKAAGFLEPFHYFAARTLRLALP